MAGSAAKNMTHTWKRRRVNDAVKERLQRAKVFAVVATYRCESLAMVNIDGKRMYSFKRVATIIEFIGYDEPADELLTKRS